MLGVSDRAAVARGSTAHSGPSLLPAMVGVFHCREGLDGEAAVRRLDLETVGPMPSHSLSEVVLW